MHHIAPCLEVGISARFREGSHATTKLFSQFVVLLFEEADELLAEGLIFKRRRNLDGALHPLGYMEPVQRVIPVLAIGIIAVHGVSGDDEGAIRKVGLAVESHWRNSVVLGDFVAEDEVELFFMFGSGWCTIPTPLMFIPLLP